VGLGLAEEAVEALHRILLIVVFAFLVVSGRLLQGRVGLRPARGVARLARLEARVDVHHHRTELPDQRRQRWLHRLLLHGLGGGGGRGLRIGGQDRCSKKSETAVHEASGRGRSLTEQRFRPVISAAKVTATIPRSSKCKKS